LCGQLLRCLLGHHLLQQCQVFHRNHRDNIDATTAYDDWVVRGSDAAHQVPIFLHLLRFFKAVWFT